MIIRTYFIILVTLLTSQVANASLVRVDITGSVDWYIEGNYFGVDSTSSVSGHIIYDDVITQTDGEYTITNYSNWEFELNIGNNTITEFDANPRPELGEGVTESWISFENGNLWDIWFRTTTDYDTGIPKSRIDVTTDIWDEYPDTDYLLEMVHENFEGGSPWLMADGGLSLSAPVPVSAVPVPASLLLFISGSTLLLAAAKRRKNQIQF